jgi:hypothetical protein
MFRLTVSFTESWWATLILEKATFYSFCEFGLTASLAESWCAIGFWQKHF